MRKPVFNIISIYSSNTSFISQFLNTYLWINILYNLKYKFAFPLSCLERLELDIVSTSHHQMSHFFTFLANAITSSNTQNRYHNSLHLPSTESTESKILNFH